MFNRTERDLDELLHSDEYAEYILDRSRGDRVICNGDSLLNAMEAGYMFDEFLETLPYISGQLKA